jgi:ubiquinone/menaquinone biosynthesis C-methylase UbiE
MAFQFVIDRIFYYNYKDNWDDKFFRDEILKKITKDSILLDLGAGAGIKPAINFKGVVQKVIGIDIDPRVVSNPYLDIGHVSNASKIPYPDSTFDIIFSDNVLEHFEYPEIIFREVYRVLKPGGFYLIKTPNKWHYIPIIAALTPYTFHKYINRIRGRRVSDTFPTFYRANSKSTLTKLAQNSSFSIDFVKQIEGRPEYFRSFGPAYLLGLFYERLVNSTSLFSGIRILLLASFKKKN